MWHLCGSEEVRAGFWWGDLMERDHFGNLGVDGKIILKWICKTWDGRGMDWIVLAQDICSCQTVVNAVMSLWVQ
jgi:hypothetical protein